MGHKLTITGVPVTPLRKFDKVYIFDMEEEGGKSVPKGLPQGGSIRYTIFLTEKVVERGQLAEDPNDFQNQRIMVSGEPSFTVLDHFDIDIKYMQGEMGVLGFEVQTIAPVGTEDTVKLNKIQVPESYLETTPREDKTQPVIEFYQQRKHFDKPILVHRETMRLVDGYRRFYLAQHVLNLKQAPVAYTDELPPEPAPVKKKRKRKIKKEKTPQKPPVKKKPEVPSEVIDAVWQAEDGRCESCGRAMGREWARVCRVDPSQDNFEADNLHLICHDCKWGEPFFRNTQVLDTVLQKLSKRMEMEPEQIAPWLIENIEKYGVIVEEKIGHKNFWLPNVGVFLVNRPKEDSTTIIKAISLYPNPEVKVKPQARTRGLPKSVFENRKKQKQEENQ